MRTAFIFHGVDGHPKENWFPSTKHELEKRGWNVIIPQFSDADHPDLNRWLLDFKQYEAFLDETSLLIGHSLGATFLLRLLEHDFRKVSTAVCVAGPIAELRNNFDLAIRSFIDHPFDWNTIRTMAHRFLAFYGDDDPYVPLAQGRELSDKLNADLHVISGGGHLNKDSGYVQFPALLDVLA
jgi:predicted alpha/beta hydrolase family esterase